MAKGPNQKLKLLYLMDILLEQTDEEHGLTMQELIAALEGCGVTAERKSIYDDLESLRTYGLDVIKEQKDRTSRYYVGSRRFELAELKLLVDSVQASKFLTAKKSGELIRKLESFASRYEAGKLHRQVYVAERVKTMNESIYYNVDLLHEAIGANEAVRFRYFHWNVKKEQEPGRNGDFYEVSPWALTWDDENYYLIAYDHLRKEIRHFRVDKMLKISPSGEKRRGKELFDSLDMGAYTRKNFGMFGGEERRVRLRCENRMAGVMIDRFGKEITLVPDGPEHFTVSVTVAVSPQFLGWVMGLGEGVVLTAPQDVAEQMREEVRRLCRQYCE